MRTAVEILNTMMDEQRGDIILLVQKLNDKKDTFEKAGIFGMLHGYLYCLSKMGVMSEKELYKLGKWCQSKEPLKYCKIAADEKEEN